MRQEEWTEEQWQMFREAMANAEPGLDQSGKPAMIVRMPRFVNDAALDDEMRSITGFGPPVAAELAEAMLLALEPRRDAATDEASDGDLLDDEDALDDEGDSTAATPEQRRARRVRDYARRLEMTLYSFAPNDVMRAVLRTIAEGEGERSTEE